MLTRSFCSTSGAQASTLGHVYATGKARRLQKVLQTWKPGQTKLCLPRTAAGVTIRWPSPVAKISRICTQYRYRSLAPSAYIKRPRSGISATMNKHGSGCTAWCDGQQPFGSASFGTPGPILKSRTNKFGEGTFACDEVVTQFDSANPFKHNSHPEHDDKNNVTFTALASVTNPTWLRYANISSRSFLQAIVLMPTSLVARQSNGRLVRRRYQRSLQESAVRPRRISALPSVEGWSVE